MTIKQAILRSLEDLKQPSTGREIYDHMIACAYYDFKVAKTPVSTVHAAAGGFIRDGDSRVQRIKIGKSYRYYLSKYEQDLDIDLDVQETATTKAGKNAKSKKTYLERDLHPLLATYLDSTQILAKTIFHEKSMNSRDQNQKWIHPDMIGIQLKSLKNKATSGLLKTVDRSASFLLSSYEIKREINSDQELKKAYFQAVSNSSWAHYGWLVAYEIATPLRQEIKRLNQSFGIGVIELSTDPFKSQVISQADYHELDFTTISKIANVNTPFQDFIAHLDRLLKADELYYDSSLRDMTELCDSVLESEEAIDAYLMKHHFNTGDGEE
jgi:hypothetical protein